MAPTPRSILITGASTGIGEGCALRFDRLGWRVFAGVRRGEDGERLAAKSSERLTWVLLDVTDPASIASGAETVGTRLGEDGLGALVNNAGIAVGGPLEYLPLDSLRRQLDVNVIGLVAVTQAFLPLLRRDHGRIVNIGSISGRLTTPMVGPYCASKHAVEAITAALRMELAPWGLHASVIEPGMVRTPIWEKGTDDLKTGLQRMPAEAIQRYGNLFAAFRKILASADRRGVTVDVVVDAVEHAVTAVSPRQRYLIGLDARLRLALTTLLPGRWMDALVRRYFQRLAAE